MPDYCNHRLVSSITDKVFYSFIALQDFKLYRNMFFRFWYQNPLTTPPRDVSHVLYRLSRLYMLVPSMSCTSGEVVVNQLPQQSGSHTHKIYKDIAVTQPTPYCSGNHKFLSLPLPKYRTYHMIPANQPRSCDTPQPDNKEEDTVFLLHSFYFNYIILFYELYESCK